MPAWDRSRDGGLRLAGALLGLGLAACNDGGDARPVGGGAGESGGGEAGAPAERAGAGGAEPDGAAGAAGQGGAGGAAGAASGGAQPDCALCAEAEARLGYRACVCRITDVELWSSLVLRLGSPFELSATKYTLPARDDARLPGVFMDANAFTLHYDFLHESFPDRFGDLDTREYLTLIQDPEAREFYAGSISDYPLGGAAVLYGFTIWDDPGDAATTITCAEVEEAYAMLDSLVDLLPLAFVPSSSNQRDMLEGCDVPSYDPDAGLDYAAYTAGVGYGTLRRYTLSGLAAATEAHDFGWQDILVLDQAPADVEAIVSGAVTGTPQGALSHLNVRSAARGTPNCYVADAYRLFEGWQDELVRLECAEGTFSVLPATLEEAQAFWDTLRPAPLAIPAPDPDWSSSVGLLELPTESAAARRAAVSRYGAKGANLATLYQRLDARYQLPGFLIPMRPYLDFIQGEEWTVDLGDGAAPHSFAETLDAWLDDPTFRTDGASRRARLAELRAAMRVAPVDVASLVEPIQDAFGTFDRMLRFRSSSNAEDSLEFSGAGLYDSVSGCLADDLDGDEEGPSRCDPSESREHTAAEALARVWASLWNAAAYEEREWYGIDHRRAAMAVLVDPRIDDELANVVAFTGNPTVSTDDRYLVNAQVGDLDVVSSDPGVYPEQELLTVTEGTVTAVDRMQGSSELPAGEWVLDDQRLEELGALLWELAGVYPVDGVVPEGATVLLDTEWKILSDGSLVIKQVRPFLHE